MILNFQKLIVEKIQYVRSRFDEKITPLVAFGFKHGVLILAKNTVEIYRKTDVLWNNKFIYGAIGEHQDIEKIVAQIANPCNQISTYLSEKDIHIQWLARKAGNFISDALKSGTLDCPIARLVLADKNSIILVDETGMILPVEHFIPHRTFIVLATDKNDERRKVETVIQEKLGDTSWKDLNFNQALKIAKEGLDVNPKHVFYELVVINSKGSKIYNHTGTIKLLNREENNEQK